MVENFMRQIPLLKQTMRGQYDGTYECLIVKGLVWNTFHVRLKLEAEQRHDY